MRCTGLWRFVVVLLISLTIQQANAGSAAKAPKNHEEFKALCMFYKLAEQAGNQEKPSDSTLELEKEEEAVRLSLRDLRSVIEAINSTATETPITVEFAQEKFEIPRGLNRTPIRVRLKALEKKLEGLFKDVNETGRCVSRLEQEARNEVKETRFGPAGEEKATKGGSSNLYATATNREDSCKGRASKTCLDTNNLVAGCSLAHDIFCLCLPGQTSTWDDYNICGVTLDANGVTTWHGTSTMTGGATINANWKKFQGHCSGALSNVEFNAESITRAIEKFESLLGTRLTATSGMTAATNYRWVLGASGVQTGEACAGTTSSGGVCVDYKDASGDKHNIRWLEKFEEALRKLKEAQRERNKFQNMIRKAGQVTPAVHAILSQATLMPTGAETATQASGGSSKPSASESQKSTLTQLDRGERVQEGIKWVTIATLL